jgi:hypothetical protein
VGWGTSALASGTGGSFVGNVAIGSLALTTDTSPTESIAIGTQALRFGIGINSCIAIGYQAMEGGAGNSHIAIGNGAASEVINSSFPVISIGDDSLASYSGSGGGQIAIGLNALRSLESDNTGSGGNISIGYQSLNALGSGEGNIAIGFQSGFNYSGIETSNIIIGYSNFGISNENNVLRLGNGTGTTIGNLNSAFICGINGISVTGSAVLVSSSDQLGVTVSSARYKDNIVDLGDSSSFIYNLRPVKFTLKSNPEAGEQAGLIAEEVYEVAPYLVQLDKEGRPNSVSYHELPAILLNEIQKLRREIDELKKSA